MKYYLNVVFGHLSLGYLFTFFSGFFGASDILVEELLKERTEIFKVRHFHEIDPKGGASMNKTQPLLASDIKSLRLVDTDMDPAIIDFGGIDFGLTDKSQERNFARKVRR